MAFSACFPGTIAILLSTVARACTVSTGPDDRQLEVTSAAIEVEIDRYVCGAWLDDLSLYEVRFADLRCANNPGASSDDPLQVGVRLALDDCTSLVPLAASAYEEGYAQLELLGAQDQARANAIVRERYWADPHLGPAMLARSAHHLAQLGIQCADCPPSSLPDVLTLTWAEFKPHVLAYLWPVRDPSTGRAHIYTCSAQNGVSALELTSTAALEAGFVAAVALVENEPTRAGIAELSERGLDVADARVAIATYIDSPEVVDVVCERVQKTAWFTGVVVTTCPGD